MLASAPPRAYTAGEVTMATLTIRGISEELVGRIKAKAQANSRSMEEEIRQTLQQEYPSTEEWTAAVRDLRTGVKQPASLDEIHRWIDQGRDDLQAVAVRRRGAKRAVPGGRAKSARGRRNHAADRSKRK